jgi:hypothetical protein
MSSIDGMTGALVEGCCGSVVDTVDLPDLVHVSADLPVSDRSRRRLVLVVDTRAGGPDRRGVPCVPDLRQMRR